MHPWVWLDGRILPLAEARISPAGAGVLNGFGVFTTLRLYGGVPFAFDRHWARLAENAARCSIPVPLGEGEARGALGALAERNAVRDGLSRITLLRGHAGLWRGAPGVPPSHLLLLTSDLRSDPPGHRLLVSTTRLSPRAATAGVKVTGSLDHLLALEAARAAGFDETVLLNERDEVTEAATANLFWMRGGTLFTPSLETGCLAGVIRDLLIELAAGLGLRVEEGRFPLPHLLEASEVFLTSAGREVAPVRAVGDRGFPGAEGPEARRLGAAFHEMALRRLAP